MLRSVGVGDYVSVGKTLVSASTMETDLRTFDGDKSASTEGDSDTPENGDGDTPESTEGSKPKRHLEVVPD